YRAATAEEAARLLEAFAQSELGKKYPMIAASWRRHWTEVIPFLRLAAGDTEDDLHDQRDREPEHAVAQGAQEPGPLSKRGGGGQADLSGLGQHRETVEKAPGAVGCGGASVCAEVWRTVYLPACGDGESVKHEPDPNTKFRIPSPVAALTRTGWLPT